MKKHLRNFEQAKDVLDYGIDLHGQLSALYHAIGERNGQTRAKMVLDYLSSHEVHRGQALRRFEEEPHAGGLDVWLQFAPSLEIERKLANCTVRPDLSVDEIMTIAMDFDDALIEIYKEAAREAEDTHAREIFESLVSMEQKEKQRFIRDAEWIQDV